MAVSHDISLHHLHCEMPHVEELARCYGWKVDFRPEDLIVEVRMKARTEDLFVVEAQCDDYKEVPPLIEFIDPDSGERGSRRAYPKGSDSFFHESGPCICAPFSRKAYGSLIETGPHGDWNPSDWMTSTVRNVVWSNHATLAGMFGMIQFRLNHPDLYTGRMGT